MYKHSLGREQYDQIWTNIERRWGSIADYWYPLNGKEWPSDIIVFPLHIFHQSVSSVALHTILKQHGVIKIWELLEDYAGEEMHVEFFLPDYTGVEEYWTSPGFDWLFYVSHENSVAIGGVWFIDAIKSVWPQWDHYLYI